MSLDMSAVKGLTEDKLEALIEIMFLAASADGEFSDVERQHFAKSVDTLTEGAVAGNKLDALLSRAKQDLDAASRSERLQAVKERLPEAGARKVALGLAEVNIISMGRGTHIAEALREDGYGATEFLGAGHSNIVDMVRAVVRRKEVPSVVATTSTIDDKAFVTVHDMQRAYRGRWRMRK